MYGFTFIEDKIEIDSSWEQVFNELSKELSFIEEGIRKSDNKIAPPVKDIFRVFKKSISDINVVILGQDPYPQEGIATGRAFEVDGYDDWMKPTKNTSLINILKELYHYSCPKYDYEKISIRELRNEIGENFKVDGPHELFKNWENKGVFLLNTSLTCEVGKPNSHSVFWQYLTRKVILEIANQKKEIIWLLWGEYAQQYEKIIQLGCKNIIVPTCHPSHNKFVGSGAFENVADIISLKRAK